MDRLLGFWFERTFPSSQRRGELLDKGRMAKERDVSAIRQLLHRRWKAHCSDLARYPNGLPDSIPARVYTRRAAEGALQMADQVLLAVQQRLLPK
jgi:hypothetical protein